ncbi:hypothetical protein [Nocardia wallacei]|uniref:hypothetical protein n=1 Tax=Nocardia wallacei TaxID=480035 RepID=UPI00245786B8|nr:hypothetical protein [Nocardia wallacei]
MVLPRGPLVAAAEAVAGGSVPPPFFVGESDDGDLHLARTLVAAILADAPASAAGLEWAVAILRTSTGALVLLNTTEGRGWLPPGLFLPVEVTTLWRWPVIRRKPADELIDPLEGVADPSRALVEFGLLGESRGRGRISALASSRRIPATVRAGLGGRVLVEDQVEAFRSGVDLASPGVGLVDRLTIAGSDELLRRAAEASEGDVRATCLELARDADARVRAAVIDAGGDLTAYHDLRHRTLEALCAGREIPASWWGQLRDADGMLAAVSRSRRLDVSESAVGTPVAPPGADALRALMFERRAGELLLLTAEEAGEQTLRDALYTYGQIVEHPLIPAANGEGRRS